MQLPGHVHIREVSPRDGLQSEAKPLSTQQKVRLIDRISDAGFKQINAVSFVSPKAVPQMADSMEVAQQISRQPGVIYDATVPNLKGAERALAARMDAIVVFVSASDAGSRANVGKSTQEALAQAIEVIGFARANGMRAFATISKAFGSAYEGVTPIQEVLAIAQHLVDGGAEELALGDTSGEATPLQTAQTVERMLARFDTIPFSLHLHDTRGMALANALAAMDAGATRFDGAIGGIGGSPFTRNSAGNLATEDFLHMCMEAGVETGIDLNRVLDIYSYLERTLEHDLPGRLGAVGRSKTALATQDHSAEMENDNV